MTLSTLHLRRPALVLSLAAPLLFGACANQAVTHSGFLGSYDKMSAAGGAKALTYARAHAAAASTADATATALRFVVIEPVALRLPPEQADSVPVALQQEAQHDYQIALRQAFAKGYTIVSQAPPEGALQVRAAITGLKPSNPTLNAVTLLLIGPVSNGGVSTESEVLDSRSGERVAAQATFTNGHLFNGGLGGYFDKLGHVRKALDAHATKLRDLAATAATPAASARLSASATPSAAAATTQVVQR